MTRSLGLQSVELVLDPVTDAAVRQQWAVLADAGLPSQADHAGASNRPHITLSVAATVPDTAERALPDVATSLPVGVRLGGLVVFGGSRRRVVARLVVPTAELLALHAAVAAVTARGADPADRTAVGGWTPHVTLARGLADEEVGRALAELGRITDHEGQAVRVRRWDGVARREWAVGPPTPVP